MIGLGSGLGINPRPPGSEVQSVIGLRQLEMTKFMIRTVSNDGWTFSSNQAKILCPSRLLSLSMELFYKPVFASAPTQNPLLAAAIDAASATNTYSIRALTKGIDGADRDLHWVVGSASTGNPLPGMYETDSGVRLYRLTASSKAPTVAAAVMQLDWYVRCRWEPNLPISDDYCIKLFAACDLEVGEQYNSTS